MSGTAQPAVLTWGIDMDDQERPAPVSRRVFLAGGVTVLTAAAAAPLAFNYAPRGHGDW